MKHGDSSVDIATGTGWTARVRFSAVKVPSLLHSVQTDSGPTQLPIQWLAGVLSVGVKLQEREADHSPPCSAEVKNGGVIFPLPHMSSWHSA
jgi:hypothetical protein